MLVGTRLWGSSPLSRGIRACRRWGVSRSRIIPALAGNTHVPSSPRTVYWDHPRSRGEYRRDAISDSIGLGSSPLSRGIRTWGAGQGDREGIIPALAGNTTWSGRSTETGRDHPRSRGEYPLPAFTDSLPDGSSPLSRGIPVRDVITSTRAGIIPALAGNTPVILRVWVTPRDHPCSRGEYVACMARGANPHGSSPLSRGIRDPTVLAGPSRRIIPALAGNTHSEGSNSQNPRDHPRSRGEYPLGTPRWLRPYGSSPLSRGIRDRPPHHRAFPGIIPALAGNTSPSAARTRAMSDHPRSRGEYIETVIRELADDGSSPLSRGIRP